MSYRFHSNPNGGDNKNITLTFTSGNTVTLGIDEGDTVLSLKKYIWKNNLDGLTAGYGRIILSSLDDEAYNLYDNATNSVINVTIRDRITNTNVDLRGEDFEYEDLSNDDFSMSNLSDANFSEADLEETIFDRANLSNANLEDSTLVNNSFEGANLSNAKLLKSTFYNVNLSGADLSYAKLQNITVELDDDKKSSVNFSGVVLLGANLSGAKLQRATLENINMSGANLFKANLYRANLQRSNLSGANLSRANLRGAILGRVNLSGANLSGADLSGSFLSGADLSGANLDGTNLAGANLSRVIGLNLSVTNRLLNAAKEGDATKIDEILKEMPDTEEKQKLKKLALNEAIKYNKAGRTIDLLVDNREVIGETLSRFDLDSIDRKELLTQNPPRLRSTEEKCKTVFDHIMQDDIDITEYLNAEDVDDDAQKRIELENRAIFFVGETPSQLNPMVMSLNQLLYNIHSTIYTSDCVKNANGQYFENGNGSRMKDAIFQFQFTSRYNVYLRNLIDVISKSDKRVFYILPLMGPDGQRIEVERVASLRNVGIENPFGYREGDHVSALHCQAGTKQQMYGIYVCEGKDDNPLYPVCVSD